MKCSFPQGAALSLTLLAASACTQYPGASVPISVTQPVSGGAVIMGQLTEDASCGNVPAQVIIYQGQNPIYQVSVPPLGQYEAQVNPGSYTIVAQTAGCSTQIAVNTSAGQQAQSNLMLMAGSTTSTVGLPQTASVPSYYPTYNPSYPTPMGYTPPSYPQCPWGYYGCGGSYYPGGGDFGAGKPNVYLSGPTGTQFSVALSYDHSTTNLLAASPASGNWTGTLTDGGLKVGQATYAYLYYDLRSTSEKLQSSDGFCVNPGELMPALTHYLESAGFHPNEIGDFQAYWGTRFPKAARYCVYPQDEKQLKTAVDLVVTPTPTKVTRVLFMVVVDGPVASAHPAPLNLKNAIARFSRPQTSGTLLAKIRRPDSKLRAIASVGEPSDGLEVREWGVGLLFEK